jgi:hypothetical protein
LSATGKKYAALGPNDCQGVVDNGSSVTDTTKVAACDLLAARKALEGFFVYLMACEQFTAAMDAHMALVSQYGGGSVFSSLQNNIHNVCYNELYSITDPPNFGDVVNCYNRHVQPESANLLHGKHGIGDYAADWENNTGMPLTSGGE